VVHAWAPTSKHLEIDPSAERLGEFNSLFVTPGWIVSKLVAQAHSNMMDQPV
jgi:hypothetical protein